MQPLQLVPIFYDAICISTPQVSFVWEHSPIEIPSMHWDYYLAEQDRIYPMEAIIIEEGELIQYVVHILPCSGLE